MSDAPSPSGLRPGTDPKPTMAAVSARSVAMARTAARCRSYPDLPFDLGALPASLEPRDAALVRAIDAAVVRRWLTLVTLIESRAERPWRRIEPTVQAALLVGAAQLYLLDRIPDHAAVDESVRWAKGERGARAGGFVNAVLRRLVALRGEPLAATPAARPFAAARDELPLADGRAWKLGEAVFAAERPDRAMEVGSVGRELFLHWIAAHGFQGAMRLAEHGLVDPPTLVTDLPSVLAADPRFLPHDQPGWFAFTGDHPELLALLAAHPGLRVQDPTSGDPVVAAAGLDPRLVIDFCAGRGTKTVQLARTFPNARIVASDPDLRRRQDLAAAATRHPNIEVIGPEAFPGHFQAADLVLLDVPCSNTGVLPRRPEASYRFSGPRLERLVAKQREIVAAAMPLLKPGGHVLYATCSLEPAENGRQADAIRQRFRLESRGERQRFPAGTPGDPPSRYADGGFWCLLRRPLGGA